MLHELKFCPLQIQATRALIRSQKLTTRTCFSRSIQAYSHLKYEIQVNTCRLFYLPRCSDCPDQSLIQDLSCTKQ